MWPIARPPPWLWVEPAGQWPIAYRYRIAQILSLVFSLRLAVVGVVSCLEMEPGEIPVGQQAQPTPAQTQPVPPPPIIIYRESRSTSPPPQPEYATVSVGPDEVPPS